VPTQEKTETIERLKTRMAGATSAVLTEFRGLSVRQLSELRKQLRPAGAEYRVVKNRLARVALDESAHAGLRAHLAGPTGLVIGRRDPAGVAKALVTFAKTNPAFRLKVGVVDGQLLDPTELRAVADLPSREVLRGQIVGTVQGPLAGLTGLLSAPHRQLAYVLAERGRASGAPVQTQNGGHA
jgi:large subunit ribosomal protein L10